MSNDTTYSLKLRHPEKARLEDVKIFLTAVKPALCRLVLNMKPDPKLSRQEYLDLLGIKKLSEVITWFGPYSEIMIVPKVGRVKKLGGAYEFKISVWANENHCGNI